jgi:polar amino acid transport system substrate-binding protein/cystine transport system substrate-binding protein/membrane-bound lytic murein transglycosylase F
MLGLRRVARDLSGLGIVAALLLLVNFLPPDTSLREVEANGTLRVCVPTAYPPLVTGDPERPGIDIELLRAVADRIGVTLLLAPTDAMGRDFNPRNWGITRARCQVLAGGVVDSALTRSFLDTGPPYAETGWAVLAPEPLERLEGRTLGALTHISGLDRIGLSGFLRREGVTVRVTRNGSDLVAGIASGDLDGGVTEALLAASLASDRDWWVAPLPDELARHNLVFGLWKGDLTLKRRIAAAFRELEADGSLSAILERYGAAPGEQGRPLL